MVRLWAAVIGVAIGLGLGCTYQARECCECMSTKDNAFLGNCLTETVDTCTEALSRDPPNVDVVQSWCRDDNNKMCPESCQDVLYRN
jgi:hypothetical protein